MENPRAQATRLRYRYRALILRGKLLLPLEAAVPLVGPDCAYHLYRGYAVGQGKDPRPAGRPTKSRG